MIVSFYSSIRRKFVKPTRRKENSFSCLKGGYSAIYKNGEVKKNKFRLFSEVVIVCRL
jgi:hypothetical protein